MNAPRSAGRRTHLDRRAGHALGSTLVLGVALALGFVPVGCGGEDLDRPPEIRLGRDECAECGMMVSEDRCSAAVLVDGEDGAAYQVFDDIGCLLDWQRANAEAQLRARYVHDYETRAWCDAGEATFLDGASVRTPMASGLLGFATRPQAEGARTKFGGTVLLWDDLAKARLAWLARRDNGER